MILSIYKIIEENTGKAFYDLELNNFICALGTDQGLSKMIVDIEGADSNTSLILEDLVSLPTLYSESPGDFSTTFITSFEFENASDLRARLHSVIESNNPELLI